MRDLTNILFVLGILNFSFLPFSEAENIINPTKTADKNLVEDYLKIILPKDISKKYPNINQGIREAFHRLPEEVFQKITPPLLYLFTLFHNSRRRLPDILRKKKYRLI